METRIDEIVVKGVTYVPKDQQQLAPEVDGMKYVIVRTYSAGVHAGYLKRKEGKEVELLTARRLWRWAGAASLSQLAVYGTSKPEDCKFPCEVPSIELTEAIEVIPCTERARASIAGVAVWME